MKTPAIEIVRALYQRHQIKPTFEEELSDHLANGIVVATPTSFLMGKAVELADGRRAWFIAGAAGSFRNALALLPWWLPFIAFCRRGKNDIKVYPTAKFIQKASAYHA